MKSRPGLIPGEALLAVGIVLAHGAAKYGDHRPAARAFGEDVDALLRHLAQWQAGAGPDEGTRQSHLAHVAARALLLLGAEIDMQKAEDPRRFRLPTIAELMRSASPAATSVRRDGMEARAELARTVTARASMRWMR